jgi:hypothetical protein
MQHRTAIHIPAVHVLDNQEREKIIPEKVSTYGNIGGIIQTPPHILYYPF